MESVEMPCTLLDFICTLSTSVKDVPLVLLFKLFLAFSAFCIELVLTLYVIEALSLDPRRRSDGVDSVDVDKDILEEEAVEATTSYTSSGETLSSSLATVFLKAWTMLVFLLKSSGSTPFSSVFNDSTYRNFLCFELQVLSNQQ